VLRVGDKEYELPILRGTLGHDLIDVRSLLAQANLLTYDPGFMCTASCISNICYINGEKGELLYRGYRIQDLA
jgi:citrate synthase